VTICGKECVPWRNTAGEFCHNMDHVVTKKHRELGKPSVPFCAFFVAVFLRRNAEDSPHPVVELEGRLGTEEVITAYAARATGAIHRNSIHMI
jgi:hypothetical protein